MDVKRPSASVSRIIEHRGEVHLTQEGAWVKFKSGHCEKLKPKEGVYILTVDLNDK